MNDETKKKIEGQARENAVTAIGQLTYFANKLHDVSTDATMLVLQMSRALDMPEDVANDKLAPLFEEAEKLYRTIREAAK